MKVFLMTVSKMAAVVLVLAVLVILPGLGSGFRGLWGWVLAALSWGLDWIIISRIYTEPK
jgi:hypothetical protein